jgi:hypothetical protein
MAIALTKVSVMAAFTRDVHSAWQGCDVVAVTWETWSP